MAFLGWLIRTPVVWFVILLCVFVAGAWLLTRALADTSVWLALAVWFAYLVAFGIVGMRIAHLVGVRDPSRKQRGAPDA